MARRKSTRRGCSVRPENLLWAGKRRFRQCAGSLSRNEQSPMVAITQSFSRLPFPTARPSLYPPLSQESRFPQTRSTISALSPTLLPTIRQVHALRSSPKTRKIPRAKLLEKRFNPLCDLAIWTRMSSRVPLSTRLDRQAVPPTRICP